MAYNLLPYMREENATVTKVLHIRLAMSITAIILALNGPGLAQDAELPSEEEIERLKQEAQALSERIRILLQKTGSPEEAKPQPPPEPEARRP